MIHNFVSYLFNLTKNILCINSHSQIVKIHYIYKIHKASEQEIYRLIILTFGFPSVYENYSHHILSATQGGIKNLPHKDVSH